jgi:hypothetical protein
MEDNQVDIKNCEIKKVTNAYGLKIYITPKGVHDLLKTMLVEADHKAEVMIDILNQRKEFTFKEFCERLGIECFLEESSNGEVAKNASLLQSGVNPQRLDEIRKEESVKQKSLCCVCKTAPSMHDCGDRRLCCKCYVNEGNPPADWHTGCMEQHKKIKEKNNEA